MTKLQTIIHILKHNGKCNLIMCSQDNCFLSKIKCTPTEHVYKFRVQKAQEALKTFSEEEIFEEYL